MSEKTYTQLLNDNARMRDLLDRRPAVNAGLIESYLRWTQLVYQSDMIFHGMPEPANTEPM